MHEWETRTLLRHYLKRGVSKAELSRRFGVSRRTIHRWVESGQLDRDLSSAAAQYSPRPRVAHKLDPYKELIEVRLGEFPKLSAKRLFDEVRAAGYDGGYSRVRDYVREVRPREPLEAPVRFETPAGHQGQVDFGTFRLPWGRRHALLVSCGCVSTRGRRCRSSSRGSRARFVGSAACRRSSSSIRCARWSYRTTAPRAASWR